MPALHTVEEEARSLTPLGSDSEVLLMMPCLARMMINQRVLPMLPNLAYSIKLNHIYLLLLKSLSSPYSK